MLNASKLKSEMKKKADEPPRRKRRIAQQPRLGLPLKETRAIRYYFNSFEGDAGLKSAWSSLVNAADGIRITPAGFLPSIVTALSRKDHDEAIDASFEAYRTLRRMCEAGRGRDVAVLWLYYGPQRINAEHARFGELAQLARFSTKVADIQRSLIDASYRQRLEAVNDKLADMGLDDQYALDRCQKSVWQEASRISENDAIRHALSQHHSLSYREDFIRTVTKQAKSVLNNASRCYMEYK